ncbi:PRC-barrel domain-containing protein [Paraburkholderia caballeronis]|uniref:PRC-barrel domain-containing protein n=1 Tax=Paraburkholderia caballeronis TaxID=416943 RepID=A0A1H7MUH4_9BURK|nr:PRC-barrel domain-containing protein [Paraburkholderia caballeronis]PXW26411.1 PRC-barrel domain protein [Paraburkholderia caballeronis]PXX01958.1 PRC-barrel domain protein [Paraburkholderia caballeronis]RAK01115.1 PRC-barrel domain protein [Paraburkholderia caballeronis]SEB97152.1 PRC-barrel domain-containing protein [Paraburkholderia caballeronis]SEL14922.1 PRC-barrel domain-containing protein [Paraburkholderia caballeronis]
MNTFDSTNRPLNSNTGAAIVGSGTGDGPGPNVMAADTLTGNKLFTSDHQEIGKISEIMLDVRDGRIAYAVLSSGSFFGMGGKLHAIPWNALILDTDEKCFRLDVTSDRVKNAPAFDKEHWPAMADEQWGSSLHKYYNRQPYWLGSRDVAGTLPPEPQGAFVDHEKDRNKP